MSTSSITLTAQWTQAGSFSVVYSLEGGPGTAPKQADVVDGLSFTVAAKPAVRPGYTFNSWSDGTTNFVPGSTYTITRSNVQLSAIWAPNPSHTVTYVINLGLGATNSPTTGLAPSQADVSEGASFIVADHTGFTRAGYAFARWTDGSTNYDPGATVTMGGNNFVLEAVWTANATRNVTYSLDGGTGTLPIQDPVAQGLTFKVADSTGFSRAGFVFSNWTNGLVVYAAGATYTASTSDITLTAVWKAVPLRTITYSLNGGTGTLPTQIALAEGATFTLADDAGITKSANTFSSWLIGAITYAPGASFKVGTTNITITAQWSAVPPKAVTYALGNGAGTIPTETPKASGAKFTLDLGDGLTRTGFSLTSWNDGVKNYAPGATYVMGNVAVTFTAVWTPAVLRSVTYQLGQGAVGTTPTQIATANGDTFTLASGSGFSKVGFTFIGWNDGATSFTPSALYTMGPQAVVFTAQWIVTAPRTVTYLLDGGAGIAPIQPSVPSGTTFTLSTGGGISKVGFSLGGWTDGSVTYLPGAIYTVGGTNITLTAIWSQAALRTVTYLAGTGTGKVPTQVPVVEGLTFKLASSAGLSRAGASFLGWSNGTTTYLPGGQYKVGPANVTLTAIWSK